MNAAYLTHHYTLIRFNQAETPEEKIKVALSYFEKAAVHVDQDMREEIERGILQTNEVRGVPICPGESAGIR